MSVQTAMTAIADKIRAILGVSGAMGLDAMATNLGAVQTDIDSAYTAVGNQGGTVPDSKVSGGLAAAISSIPLGVMVQRKTGSFTVNSSGEATADCGFIPDWAAVDFGVANGTKATISAPFYEISADDVTDAGSYESTIWSDDDLLFLTTLRRTASGFSVYIRAYDMSSNKQTLTKTTYSYVAIKYT